MRTVYGDHERFIQTYFTTFKGTYVTGDGARRDEDGYWWITGRVDDVINVSGHRMGTAEVESALVAHPAVAEAAVVGYPHEIKGQGIFCYVTLKSDIEPSEDLRKELVGWVRKEIGPIASPDVIQWAPGLPKTRSGKIMRRILRKIAANEFDTLGDTSTLADPAVVNELIDNRKEICRANARADGAEGQTWDLPFARVRARAHARQNGLAASAATCAGVSPMSRDQMGARAQQTSQLRALAEPARPERWQRNTLGRPRGGAQWPGQGISGHRTLRISGSRVEQN